LLLTVFEQKTDQVKEVSIICRVEQNSSIPPNRVYLIQTFTNCRPRNNQAGGTINNGKMSNPNLTAIANETAISISWQRMASNPAIVASAKPTPPTVGIGIKAPGFVPIPGQAASSVERSSPKAMSWQ
jgi:hypothetical protein